MVRTKESRKKWGYAYELDKQGTHKRYCKRKQGAGQCPSVGYRLEISAAVQGQVRPHHPTRLLIPSQWSRIQVSNF